MAYTPTVDDMDVDFNGVVNYPGDLILVAGYAANGGTQPPKHTDFVLDVNRDGVVNTPGDAIPIGAYITTHSPAQLVTRWHGRNPFLQPFATTSIWNTPIGASATRQNLTLTPPNVTFVEDDVIIMSPMSPITPIWETNLAESPYFNPWNGDSRCTRYVPNNNLAAGLPGGGCPLPPSAVVPDSNGADTVTPNHSAAILLADRRTLFQTQPLTHCGNGDWTSAYTFGGTSAGTTDLYGHGIFGAHGGSDLSSIGGTIRLHELVPGGKIPHALKIVVPADILYFNPSNPGLYARTDGDSRFVGGHHWPARTNDYGAVDDYTGTNPNLRMGSLLALKTTFDITTLLTEPARIIAKALQNYGAYICDTGGNTTDFRCYYFGTERAGGTPIKGVYGNKYPLGLAGPRVADNFESFWPLLGAFSEVTSGDWFDDIVTIVANLQLITDSGPGTQTGTATSVTANSMYDATNDWWQSFNLTGGVITMGGRRATITSNRTTDGTLFFTAGWDGATPTAGAYSIAWSGTIGGAGTRRAPLAPSIGT